MPDSVTPRVASEVFAQYLLLNKASSCRAVVRQRWRSGRPSTCSDLNGRTRGVTTGDTSFGTSGDDLE